MEFVIKATPLASSILLEMVMFGLNAMTPMHSRLLLSSVQPQLLFKLTMKRSGDIRVES